MTTLLSNNQLQPKDKFLSNLMQYFCKTDAYCWQMNLFNLF